MLTGEDGKNAAARQRAAQINGRNGRMSEIDISLTIEDATGIVAEIERLDRSTAKQS